MRLETSGSGANAASRAGLTLKGHGTGTPAKAGSVAAQWCFESRCLLYGFGP